MNEYIKPKLEIFALDSEDIVTGSPTNETEDEKDNIIFDNGGW